jgi:hypothetical protein
LKEKINKITKDYNTWDKLLKMKDNENKRINKYIDDIKKNKIKKIEEAQTDEITKTVEKQKEKHEDIFQQQNSIRLAYETKE